MHNRSKLATFLALLLILSFSAITTGFSGPLYQTLAFQADPDQTFPLNDARGHWAEPAIAEMYAKDVMRGYQDSSFRPNKPVTFVEAVVLMERLLGYTPADTELESGDYLHDVFNIPEWAAGYVSMALRQQLVEYSQIQKLSQQLPLTRQDGALLSVRALDWTKLAKQKKNAILPFTDVAHIDQTAKGSIAVVLERRVMNGYPDNTFQPSGPVSRAEMAVLLSNIGQQISYVNSGETAGFIKAVDLDKKQISVLSDDGKETDFSLPQQYLLYLNNKPATLDSLSAGSHIRIIKSDSSGLVVLVAQTISPDTGTPVSMEEVNPIQEAVEVQQWVETNKVSENYAAAVFGNSLYLLATRGEKMTSGFTVNITKVSSSTNEKNSNYRVWVDRENPAPGTLVNQVISYPYSLVRLELPAKSVSEIIFVNHLNQEITKTAIQ